MFIIASKISSIPSPVFPEQEIALVVSIPTTSSISFFVLSISEAGKSILFNIGIISTGSTSAKIKKLGYDCSEVSKITNSKEILSGACPYARRLQMDSYGFSKDSRGA